MTALAPIIIDGEVLSARECVRVIGSAHPLRNERREWYLPAGLTIRELLNAATDGALSPLSDSFVIHLEGDYIEERFWHRIRPKPGTCLVFRPRLHGGGMGKTLALLAVTVLALVVTGGFAAPLLGTAFAAGTFGAAALGLAITVGGTLLINTLFPVAAPETLAKEKERYSITGAGNNATPYQPIPVVLGMHRIFPVHAASPYTEIVGDDQYLRMLLVWGYGPLAIDQIKIGETPLTAYEDVTVETDYGYDGDPTTALFPQSVSEDQLNILLETGIVNERTTSEAIDEFSVDFTWPQGLYKTNTTTGAAMQASTAISIYYRLAGAGTYILATNGFWAQKTTTIFRTGARVVVPARGKYDVAVVRTDPFNALAANLVSGVNWTALRGLRRERPINFAKNIAVTAIRIRATGQLNGVVNSLNAIVTTVVPTYVSFVGSVWVWTVGNKVSNNPAELFRYVLQGAANARPVPDAKLDLPTLALWGGYCAWRGWAYNNIINTPRSVYQQLADIAAAGRAIIIFKDGQWSVVFDDITISPPVIQHFTPRNSWGFSSSRAYRPMPHGWRVNFVNEAADYQDDERIVYDDGYTAANATDFEAIEFPGVTNANLIWKHGRFHIAQARLRPEVYQLTTDFENLVCLRGDRVRVTHDIPLWGQISGRVTAVTGNLVTLDEVIIMEVAKSYCIRFRSDDGTSNFCTVTTQVGERRDVTRTSGASPDVGDLFMFGELNAESVILRVLSVEPGDNLSARLQLVDDAPEINSADTGVIPAFNSGITPAIDPAMAAPVNLRASEVLVAQGGGIIVSTVHLSWQVERTGYASYYEIQRTNSSGTGAWFAVATVTTPETTYDIQQIEPGTYAFRVRSAFANGQTSSWITISGVQVVGLFGPPEDITNFYINVLGSTATLTWDRLIAINVSHYEIRYSPLLTGVTWGTSSPLLPTVMTTSVQVPSMSGTFLIKAVTFQYVSSLNATLITSDIPGLESLNAVATITEDPTFTGVKDGTELVGVELRLASSDHMDDWVTLASIPSLYGGNLVSEGTYYFAGSLNLGAVYVSRITSEIEAVGETLSNVMSSWTSLASIVLLEDSDPSEWNTTLQYRKTMVNPVSNVWSAWSDVIVGDILAWGIQFRLVIASLSDLVVVPVVTDVTVYIDMDDRIDAGKDVAAAAGGTAIVFAPAFLALLGVSIAAQNLATGDFYTITAKSATGFTIQFKNSAGTGVARTFDWVAKGYGRKS